MPDVFRSNQQLVAALCILGVVLNPRLLLSWVLFIIPRPNTVHVLRHSCALGSLGLNTATLVKPVTSEGKYFSIRATAARNEPSWLL